METQNKKIAGNAELLTELKNKTLSLNGVVRSMHVMSQLISVTELYCICLLFEAPKKRKELYDSLVRDISAKVHALQRLREKALVECLPDTTIRLTDKGVALYLELLKHIK